MNFYFSCEYKSILKINGVYFGKLTPTPLKTAINTGDFIEIYPLSHGEKLLCFLVDDDFFNPPENVYLTDLKSGYAVFIKSAYRGGDFKVYCQNKFGDIACTLYNDDGVTFIMERGEKFVTESICYPFSECEILPVTVDGINFISLVIKGEKTLLYLFNDQLERVFVKEVDEFSFEQGFVTKQRFNDMAKHLLTTFWRVESNKIIIKESKVESKNLDNLILELKPYAFLEEFLLGGDYQKYLSDEMQKSRDLLHGFLGDYICCFPPLEDAFCNYVGILTPLSERKYQATYLLFEFNGDKICNIKKADV